MASEKQLISKKAGTIIIADMFRGYIHFASKINIESTAGADASVKALKLYDMKLLTLAYLALLHVGTS